ncbi:MAG: hypothetical protein SOY60_01365 [Fusobacterium gastrosuis]|uniref:hypothetical protein n=1 Tax=Fusobacterium gastrosuis TaxID=1755100 RepID=UPI002A8FE730|nr:hypothetical protein [Fusobacterium gastrosuis]
MKFFLKLDTSSYYNLCSSNFELKSMIKGILFKDKVLEEIFFHKINAFRSYENLNIPNSNFTIISRIWNDYFNPQRDIWLVIEVNEVSTENMLKASSSLPINIEPILSSEDNNLLKDFYIKFYFSKDIEKKMSVLNDFIEKFNEYNYSNFYKLLFNEYILLAINNIKKNLDNSYKELSIKKIIADNDLINLNIVIENFSNDKDDEYNRYFKDSFKKLRDEYKQDSLEDNIVLHGSIIRSAEYYFKYLEKQLRKKEFYNQNFFKKDSNRMKLSYILNRKRTPTLEFIMNYMDSQTNSQFEKTKFYNFFIKYNELNGYLEMDITDLDKEVLDRFDIFYQNSPILYIDLSEVYIDVSISRMKDSFYGWGDDIELRFVCIRYTLNNPWKYYVGYFERESLNSFKINKIVSAERDASDNLQPNLEKYLIKNIIMIKKF